MKGRRRTTIFRPGLMSNLIIYYKLINYKCMDNIMKCTPLGEQKSLWLRKTLLIMKFFVLFLLLGTVPCWAGIAYSQNVKMSLDMENTTVHDVINAIEKKGNFYFTYNLNQVNVNRKVSIKVENKTINQILDRLFSKSGIDYKIENRHIVLYKQATPEVEAVKQQKSINGIVADEQGEPIIGASVLEKGTTNGTITDLDGRFTLSIGKGTELIVSYVGYTTKTVKIGNQSTIKIVLIEDTKTLDEVVVIGYGTQKKSDVSGSVTSVSGDKLSKIPTANAEMALQGMAPGLSVNFGSGAAGSSATLQVRGVTSWKDDDGENSESNGDGRFAVSSKTILEALKEIPEQPLTFLVNTENLEITVQYQNGKYSLMGQNADEYPQAPALGANAVHVTMGAPVMLAGINRSLFATADDELRPVMNGIYFDITTEDITFVASDGHKLVRNKTFVAHGDEKAAFILPKKPATLLKNLLPKEQGDVQIDFDDRNATFTLENYSMICRLIEGRYPNYNSVIPQDNPHKATIDRMMLISALRRVSVFSSQASSLIKLRLSENQIQISAQDIDFSTSAEETLTCQYTGSPMSIGFKSTFLIDILNNISAQEILFELADPSRAGVIVPVEQEEKEDLLMLLMPMMLND